MEDNPAKGSFHESAIYPNDWLTVCALVHAQEASIGAWLPDIFHSLLTVTETMPHQ